MAIDAFIPELWAASLVRHLDKRFVYASEFVTNREHEGEIQDYGNTVHLQNVNDVTVGTYVPGTDMAEGAADTDIDTTLIIDQAKFWNVKVDDLHEAQAKPKLMDQKTKRAAKNIVDIVDQFIASFQSGVVAAGNVIQGAGVPIVVTEAAKAYERLVDLGVLLDEQNVPEEDRFAVIPPWFHGLLQKDDRFVRAGTAATDAVLRNGHVGEAAGFAILKSNNVPNTAGKDHRILAGTNQGVTYAEQVVKVEDLRHPKQFASLVRGLYVYGAKVPNPEELAVLRVSSS